MTYFIPFKHLSETQKAILTQLAEKKGYDLIGNNRELGIAFNYQEDSPIAEYIAAESDKREKRPYGQSEIEIIEVTEAPDLVFEVGPVWYNFLQGLRIDESRPIQSSERGYGQLPVKR